MNSILPDIYNTHVDRFTSFFIYPFSFPKGQEPSPSAEWAHREFQVPLMPDQIEGWKFKRNYGEYIYFHDYVREFLFPRKTSLNSDTQHSVRVFEYKLPEKPQIRLTYSSQEESDHGNVKGQNTLMAWIKHIYLHLYPHGIGILSIETCDKATKDHPSQETKTFANDDTAMTGGELLLFNNMFRRLYPAYFERRDKDGAFQQVMGNEFPETVTVATSQRTIFEYSASKIPKTTFLKRNRSGKLIPAFSSFIGPLLDGLFGQNDLPAYTPLLDDRMLVFSYIVFPSSLKDSLSQEDRDIFYSHFLYVDNPEKGYRYDRSFVMEIMEAATYSRWENYQTKIGFSRYSGVFLYFGHYDHLYRTFESMYHQMFLLTIYYRVSLIRFADEMAQIARRDPGTAQLKNYEEYLKELRGIHTRFMHFMSICWFKEVTHQDQGIELFQLMRKAFDLDDMYAQVKEEIERADELGELLRQQHIAQFSNRMTIIGIIFAAAALIPVLFDHPLLLLSIFVIGFIVLPLPPVRKKLVPLMERIRKFWCNLYASK